MKNNIIDPYCLGYILGDGSIYLHQSKVVANGNQYVSDKKWILSIVSKDKEHLEALSKFLPGSRIYEQKPKMVSHRNGDYLSECNFQLQNWKGIAEGYLLEGIQPSKSINGSWLCFEKMEDGVFRDVVRGLLDSDGTVCIHKRKNRNDRVIVGLYGHISYLRGIHLRLTKLGFSFRLRVYKGLGRCELYKSKEINSFYEWLYKDAKCYLKRKRRVFEKFLFPAGFVNTECRYYPCHNKVGIDCTKCYCPFYWMLMCPGNPVYLRNHIRDCSSCTYPHESESIRFLTDELNKVIDKAKIGRVQFWGNF